MEAETKLPLALCRQFHIYYQILLATVIQDLSPDLQIAVAFYQERLMGLLMKCTFESVKHFHFAFHLGRIIDGIDQPAPWTTIDASLENQVLRYKSTLATFSVPKAALLPGKEHLEIVG